MYDLLGGNSSYSKDTSQFVVGATFPKDSETALIQVNRDKLSIGYDQSFVDMLLVRTRLHKFLDSTFLRATFSQYFDYLQPVNDNFLYTIIVHYDCR